MVRTPGESSAVEKIGVSVGRHGLSMNSYPEKVCKIATMQRRG